MSEKFSEFNKEHFEAVIEFAFRVNMSVFDTLMIYFFTIILRRSLRSLGAEWIKIEGICFWKCIILSTTYFCPLIKSKIIYFF